MFRPLGRTLTQTLNKRGILAAGGAEAVYILVSGFSLRRSILEAPPVIYNTLRDKSNPYEKQKFRCGVSSSIEVLRIKDDQKAR